MKSRTAFISYIATSVFIATTLLSAQQSAPPTGNMNMSEEQVNNANIELMRQDIRSQRKKVVAATSR